MKFTLPNLVSAENLSWQIEIDNSIYLLGPSVTFIHPSPVSTMSSQANGSQPVKAWTQEKPKYLFSASVRLGKTVGPIPMLEGGTRYVERRLHQTSS